MFDPTTSTLHLTQRLLTRDVRDVQHFHDYRADRHYILILQINLPAKVYWFGNEQLLEWQELLPEVREAEFSAFASLGLENLILVANKSDALLFVDDFKGHNKLNFTYNIVCDDDIIKNSDLDISRKDKISSADSTYSHAVDTMILFKDTFQPRKFILGYQCINLKSQSKTLKVAIIEAEDVVIVDSPSETDELLQSMENLEEMLNEQQSVIDELQNILDTDAIMLKDSNQIWPNQITVKGPLEIEGLLSVDNLNLKPNESQSVEVTVDNLKEMINLLEIKEKELKIAAEDLLYKSKDQTIFVPIKLNRLKVETIEFEEDPSIKSINGLTLDDLQNNYLRLSTDQTLSMTFGNISADNLIINSSSNRFSGGSINKTPFENLLRKSLPNQIITGHHTIRNVVSLGNISHSNSPSLPIQINNLTTTVLVTYDLETVEFTGEKSFSQDIHSGYLDVNMIGEHHFDSWRESLVRSDDPGLQTLTGNVTIGNVIVKGNVNVPRINDIDLSAIEKNTVKKTGGMQIVTGPVSFTNDLNVTNNLNATVMNDIRWEEIIDSSTNQDIIANFSFDKVEIFGDLISDNINDLDISTDAVLVNSDQVIHGRIRFEQSVLVSGENGVTMDSSSRINKVDPSQLRAFLSNVGTVTIRKPFEFKDTLSFNCSITARTLNGITVDELPTHYWRKSKDQTIPVDVRMSDVTFDGPLGCNSLNRVTIDQYLQQDKDQVITGKYNFRNGVVLEKDLHLDSDSLVDGVNLTALKNSVVTLNSDQIIEEEQNFTRGISTDHLWVTDGIINDVNITELVFLDNSNIITGNVTFEGPVNATELSVSGKLAIEELNGVNIQRELDDMVKVDEAATLKGNLIFNVPAKIYELKVTGTIDKVDLEDLNTNYLKKYSTIVQNVSGSLSIEGDGYFDGYLSIQELNGEPWENLIYNVVTNDFNGTIYGQKTIANIVIVDGNTTIKNLNGEYLQTALENILTKSSDQEISGDVIFLSDIIANNITTPAINGVSFEELLKTNDAHSVNLKSMDTEFEAGITLSDVSASSDFISGCNVKKLENHMNWKEFHGHIIPESLTIDSLTVIGDAVTNNSDFMLSKIPGSDSRVNFTDYMDSFVTKSDRQVIVGEVLFSKTVHVTNYKLAFVNEYSIDDIFRYAMRRTDSSINCTLKMENNVVADNVRIINDIINPSEPVTVNDLSLEQLAKDAVRKSALRNETDSNRNENRLIRGKKTFEQGFIVLNNMNVETINNISTSNFVRIDESFDKNLSDTNIVFDAILDIQGNLVVSLTLFQAVLLFDTQYIFGKNILCVVCYIY